MIAASRRSPLLSFFSSRGERSASACHGFLLTCTQSADQTGRPAAGARSLRNTSPSIPTTTLANIPDDAAVRTRELEAVGSKLALDLSFEKVALPNSTSSALSYSSRRQPLAQIAYLSPRDGPVAFCIIADGATDEAIRFEQRGAKTSYTGRRQVTLSC